MSCFNQRNASSITCRKRHLKCDEVKPICGACAKRDNACEFATSDRCSINVLVSDTAVTETVPELSTQQITSPVENNEHASSTAQTTPVLFESREATVPAWPSYAVDAHSSPIQLDQLTGSQLVSSQSPVTFQNSSLSPSNASFAAVRWFGLLAHDAARDSSQVSTIPNSWANQSLSLDQPGSDGLTQPSSLQRATQVLDVPSSTYASHDTTHIDASGSTLGEEQIWQSREPIELLPTEGVLFEHFVNQVSPWVFNNCHLSVLDTFGLQPTPFTDRSFRPHCPIFYVRCAFGRESLLFYEKNLLRED